MNKKKKKTKTCIDCDQKTDDYYPVYSNKGTVHRCACCYELWLTRSTRYNVINTGLVRIDDAHTVDANDPLGRFNWN